MSIHESEQRFMDFTRFALPGAEVAQELFGPVRPRLQQRPVVFKHEGGLVPRVGVRRAEVGGMTNVNVDSKAYAPMTTGL